MSENLSEPLIEKGEGEWLQSKHTPRSRGWVVLTLLQAFTICLIPAAYFLGYNQGARVLPKLPTHEVSHKGYKVQLQKLDDDFDIHNPANEKYKGLPRPELDEAWNDLINHMNIRVHPQEVRNANFTSVELNDGSGDFFGMPTVFHSLHCLKTLRRIQFPDSYPEDWERYKPDFPGGINDHVDHCIDNLRQALMCQGDMSLYTYEWIPGREKPMPIAQMDHLCVNWDNLMDWASERSFALDDKLLTNPQSDTAWVPDR